MRVIVAGLVAVITLSTGAQGNGKDNYEKYNAPAVFEITNEIIGNELKPFTATITGFGNSLFRNGAFEPIIYRNMYVATENSPNRVVATQHAISHWNTLKSGALDNAEISIYRVENAKFVHVREDKIKINGFHASGWVRLLPKSRVIRSDVTHFEYQWGKYSRPDSPYYFTVRAVDSRGNLSREARPLSFTRPVKLESVKLERELAAIKNNTKQGRESVYPAPSSFEGRIDRRGVLKLTWSPLKMPDIAGYIVYISDFHPTDHKGFYFSLEKVTENEREFIKKGDLVFLRKKIYTWSRNQYISNRVWGAHSEINKFLPGLVNFFPDENPRLSWKLEKHGRNTSVEESGETYLSLKAATTNTITLGRYTHSGTKQSWLDVLEKKPYIAEVWLKADKGGKVTFGLTGPLSKGYKGIKPSVFRVSSKWKKYTTRFTPQQVLEGAGSHKMTLQFSGPGTFGIDNFRIYRADTKFLDYLPRDYIALTESGVNVLRTHGLIKTKTRTYDLEQLTNPGGVISGSENMNTLSQSLAMMKKAGIQPWLQIEPHLTPDEWRGLVEYLAAPFDVSIDTRESKPWAYKRVKQGQVNPWVKEFETIYFELGNETWNSLFYPWVFPPMKDAANGKKYSFGEVYGMYQEFVISVLRQSKHWKQNRLDSKFKFVLGGWSGIPSYSIGAAARSPSSDYLTVAAYNGGWDENEGPPSTSDISFFNVLNQVSQSAIPVADDLKNRVNEINRKRQKKIWLGTYEAGPGYALNGLNNAKVSKEDARQQELVMKSLAAGTATIDSFLARAYRGYEIQNFFIFKRGDYWKSHAQWHKGGHAHPSWQAISLFNNKVSGAMLETETHSVPRIDLTRFKRRKAVKNAPMIAAYAIKGQDQVAVFLISRKVPHYPFPDDSGFTPVTLLLPFKEVESIELFKMEGELMSNNIDTEDAGFSKSVISPGIFTPEFEIGAKTAADNRGLPPGSTYLYIFKLFAKN